MIIVQRLVYESMGDMNNFETLKKFSHSFKKACSTLADAIKRRDLLKKMLKKLKILYFDTFLQITFLI